MQILMKLLIAVLALVAVLAIVGLVLPSTAHVERSAVISAPQSTVFALVNGYARFNEWSPWAEMDPEMRRVRISSRLGAKFDDHGARRGQPGRMSVPSTPGALVS